MKKYIKLCFIINFIFFIFTTVNCQANDTSDLNSTDAIELIKKWEINGSTLKFYFDNSLNATKEECFFVNYDEQIDLKSLDTSILSIPFITSIVPLVWLSGKNYTIDEMDADLFITLKKIRHIYTLFYPKIKFEGQLIPRNITRNTPLNPSESKVAILFSGGLDATTTALRHLDKKQLLIGIWGTNLGLEMETQWSYVSEKKREFANYFKNEFTCIRSNYLKFIFAYKKVNNLDLPIFIGLNHPGLAAPILFSNGISTLYMASSYTRKIPVRLGTHPLLDNNVSFADVNVYHDCAELNRIKKNELIITMAKSIKMPLNLMVCNAGANGGNCGNCEKCFRSENDFILLNQNPKKYGLCNDVNDTIKKTRLFFAGNPHMKPVFLVNGLKLYMKHI